jgi:hypothetical protein
VAASVPLHIGVVTAGDSADREGLSGFLGGASGGITPPILNPQGLNTVGIQTTGRALRWLQASDLGTVMVSILSFH